MEIATLKNILIKNITQENFDQYLDDFITLDALKISNDACEFKGFGVIQGNDEGILEKLQSVVDRLMEIRLANIAKVQWQFLAQFQKIDEILAHF